MTKLAVQGLFLALVVFASCKKNSTSSASSGGGTITATVDGVQTTFNTILNAKDTVLSGVYVLSLSGATSLTPSSPELSITIDGSSPVTTGTYNLNSTGSATNFPAISYSQGVSVIYETDLSGSYSTSVIITSLTKTNVQGTFSGVLTLDVGSGATTKAITDGKFDVNFK